MLQIDAAISGPWDSLGNALTRAGLEDASGSRRYYAPLLAKRDYERVCRDLRIMPEGAEALRQEFVMAFGEPEEAGQ